jgi:hypothetical protein
MAMKRIFLRMEREGRRVQDGIVMIAFMDIASYDEFSGGGRVRGIISHEQRRESLGVISGIGGEETVLCMIG